MNVGHVEITAILFVTVAATENVGGIVVYGETAVMTAKEVVTTDTKD